MNIKNKIISLVTSRPNDRQGIYLDESDSISKELNLLDDKTYRQLVLELKKEFGILVVYGWLSEYCISW